MPVGRCKTLSSQNNQAALRDERPERELCTLRLPLEARAVVFLPRAVVLLLLRPELPERDRADAVRPRPELREELAAVLRRFPPLRLRADVRDEPDRELRELLRLRAEVRDEPDRELRVVRLRPDDPEDLELLAAVERERVPEVRREALERPRACMERLRLPPRPFFCCAVSRLTSLLNRLAESGSNKNARLLSSNLRKKSSHEISSKVPSPLNPGKSIRRMPGSPPRSLALTVEGTPPRSSAHRRISS